MSPVEGSWDSEWAGEVTQEERLRQLALCSPKKRKLKEVLPFSLTTDWEGVERTEPNSSWSGTLKDTSWNRENYNLIQKIFLTVAVAKHYGRSLERLWNPHPWRYLEIGCIKPWETCCNLTHLKQESGLDDLLTCLPAYIVLWFCVQICRNPEIKWVSKQKEQVSLGSGMAGVWQAYKNKF